MKKIFILAAMVVLASCSKTGSDTTKTTDGTPQQVQKQSEQDGEYAFDTAAFKKQLEQDDGLKNVPPDLIDSMLKKFAEFKIDVKAEQVVVTFGTDVIRGVLTPEASTGEGTKFKMTPTDADKKDDIAYFVFTGNTLVLDPGKGDDDKLYFVKK